MEASEHSPQTVLPHLSPETDHPLLAVCIPSSEGGWEPRQPGKNNNMLLCPQPSRCFVDFQLQLHRAAGSSVAFPTGPTGPHETLGRTISGAGDPHIRLMENLPLIEEIIMTLTLQTEFLLDHPLRWDLGGGMHHTAPWRPGACPSAPHLPPVRPPPHRKMNEAGEPAGVLYLCDAHRSSLSLHCSLMYDTSPNLSNA